MPTHLRQHIEAQFPPYALRGRALSKAQVDCASYSPSNARAFGERCVAFTGGIRVLNAMKLCCVPPPNSFDMATGLDTTVDSEWPKTTRITNVTSQDSSNYYEQCKSFRAESLNHGVSPDEDSPTETSNITKLTVMFGGSSRVPLWKRHAQHADQLLANARLRPMGALNKV